MPLDTSSYASILALRQLKMQVHLGVGEEERGKPQSILLDISFYLPQPPAAANDDEGTYLCYYSISEKVKTLCERQPYRLIEYLTHAVYRLLRGEIAAEIKIGLTLHKLSIQLGYAQGGARYSYSDLPPGAWVAPG